MTNSIKNIVSEAIKQAGMEASSYNRTMTLADVKTEINCVVEFIKFDTNVARLMFMGFIETELQKVVASLYPAKLGMDQNGNYTSNSKLWA
jgi:hypothetical protein